MLTGSLLALEPILGSFPSHARTKPPATRSAWAAELPRNAQPASTFGVWITNSPSPVYYNRQRIKQAVAELKEAGFNAIYPNVWSRGTTFHTSRFAPVEPTLAKVGSTGAKRLV